MTSTVYGNDNVVSFDHLRDIFHDRTGTIRWFYLIKNICESKHCLDIFDLGVHIFDGFLSRYFSTGERNEHKTKEFFGLYEAASMILSSKLHDQKSDLSFASFPYYSEEHLSDAERVILTTIDYKIDSLNNPLFLARKMCHLLPRFGDEQSKNIIDDVAEILAAFYVNNMQMTFFSTTTVALSAVLLRFSQSSMQQDDTRYIFDAVDDLDKVKDVELCLKYMYASISSTKDGNESKSTFEAGTSKLFKETSPVSVARIGN